MAELGVVASGLGVVSLAIQIGDSILKLKDFWDSAKDAPEEIRYLIEEIETLGLVLSDIGKNSGPLEIQPASAKRCLDLCSNGARILEEVVRSLEVEMSRKRKIGAIKAVLKKGVLDRARERLRSAQVMLLLSNQVFSEALQQSRHEIQRQWAESHQREIRDLKASFSPTGSRPNSENDCKRLERQHEKLTAVSKCQRKLFARIRTPTWVSNSTRAFEISGYRAPSGWLFSFHAYIFHPTHGKIYDVIQNGDFSDLQAWFSQGRATPFDRLQNGWTLLDLAAFDHKLEMCQFLIEQGADPERDSHFK